MDCGAGDDRGAGSHRCVTGGLADRATVVAHKALFIACTKPVQELSYLSVETPGQLPVSQGFKAGKLQINGDLSFSYTSIHQTCRKGNTMHRNARLVSTIFSHSHKVWLVLLALVLLAACGGCAPSRFGSIPTPAPRANPTATATARKSAAGTPTNPMNR